MNANFPVPPTLEPNLWPTSNLYSLSRPPHYTPKYSTHSDQAPFAGENLLPHRNCFHGLILSVMLAVSPLRTTTTATSAKDGCRDQADMEFLSSSAVTTTPPSFSVVSDVDFPDFDSIDFDDLFGGDALPYLEMEPAELLADFSICPEDSSAASVDYSANQVVPNCSNEDQCKVSTMERSKEEEIESQKSSSSPSKESEHKAKKSSKSSCNNDGKRKTKVDWTPDLHRRFVQAVEQLGVDKAVPSRILELMGIDCLTRHNVASHLQKYRSHRKHLLAREAEAANWTQKRQMYGIAVAPPPPSGGTTKGSANHPWHAPTMGFPPPTPPPIHPYRSLHVWGHPTHHVDHQSPPPMPIWPKQLIPPLSPLPPPPHAWAASPPADPSLWHSRHQRVPNAVTPITPYFPQPLPAMRFAVAQPVPGIPPPATYIPDQHGVGAPAVTLQSGLGHPDPLDLHPTKESIDAAIGDVLSKPWLPLPIGLKPPSTDSVMGELQRQGVPAIPPSCA